VNLPFSWWNEKIREEIASSPAWPNGGIAQIMSKAMQLHYSSKIKKKWKNLCLAQRWRLKIPSHFLLQRSSDTWHFQTVRQSSMYQNPTNGKEEWTCVLSEAFWMDARKYTIVILLKRTARFDQRHLVFVETMRREKLWPVTREKINELKNYDLQKD